MKELYTRKVYDDSPSTEENLRAIVETPQKVYDTGHPYGSSPSR